jgi:hypothetical protein
MYEHNLLPHPVDSIPNQTQRIEGLWACYSTVKAYLDYFFRADTLSLLTYLYIPTGVCTQVGHCFVTLFRLSTFESPDVLWDRQRIISELDVSQVVRQWTQIYESAQKAAGIDDRGADGQVSPWEHSNQVFFNTILKWWDSKIRPSIMNQEHQLAEQGAQRTLDASLPSVDFSDVDFNFDNELWMMDVLSNGLDFRSF